MKRIALYIGMAVALVISCSIQEENFETPQKDDVVFYASFEQPSEGTRVYANDNLYLRWTADDRVSIFNKITYNQQYKFLGETGDNSGGFNRVDAAESETGIPISHVVSVYPFQEGSKISEEEVLTLTLPAEQHYAENTFGLGANTMVSVSSDNVLQYKNVGGYLRLNLYGEGVSVSSITLKGNNGEKLAGTASVTMPVDGVPSVEMASDATTEISLICDTPVQLGANAEESTPFWFVVPPVTFDKGFTVSFTKTSGSVFEKSTSRSIIIERNHLSKMSPIEVVGGAPTTPIPEAVDLGLPSGLKWGSFNVGASKPEEYGDYYAWGETEPKSNIDLFSNKWWILAPDYTTWLTKYCTNSICGYNGFTDGKTVLDPEDDTAYVNLGGKWRMPTDAEFTELWENCTWEWTSMNGINGQKVTGPNGKSIFLPAAGGVSDDVGDAGSFGYYWSSSLYTDYPYCAWFFGFSSDEVGKFFYSRYSGFSVRPVYGDSSISIIPVMNVTLDKTELELIIGRGYPLEATVLPENATNKSVSWSSNNESVATVSSSGVVIGLSAGTAIITVTTADGGKTATCAVTVKAMDIPEAVDLGLPSGLKWASFNLGASKPEEYGDYYAWGETEPYYICQDPPIWKEGKELGYWWHSNKWTVEGDMYQWTKYCTDSLYGYEGFTDGKTVLDPEDDAAHVNIGGKWRMPTKAEWTELLENCTWEWTTLNGVNGRKVTSKKSGYTGRWIFLPAAGSWESTTSRGYMGFAGLYWSSSLNTDNPCFAWGVDFGSDVVYGLLDNVRFYGYSVRPVIE